MSNLKAISASHASTKKASSKSSSVPDNWKPNIDYYTGDDLIDAYVQGKKVGHNERYKVLQNQLNSNIEIATTISEKLYEQAAHRNIKLQAIHLKAEDITKFKAVFVADAKDFISDEFREMYIISRELQKEVESDNFYISFSFMPFSKQLSEDCLVSDGFFMKYEKE